jgi:hypothetical protein
MKINRVEHPTQIIFGQPSWHLASKQVDAYVTVLGGHLGPVQFNLPGRQVTPYSVAPWAEEKYPSSLEPVLQALRGDFFCLPFGGNGKAFRGEKHPVHGETASARWTFVSSESRNDLRCLHLQMKPRVRKGCVDKKLFLYNGHQAIYCEHTISGMNGPIDFGHHAMLKFPDLPGSGLVSTSPFVRGQVCPLPFENPEAKGYYSLKPGAHFDSLRSVPTLTQDLADLSRYPARRGFEDLVMLVGDPNLPFAWTAVTFPQQRYVWFALKDPRLLRHTIMWISNGGRHYPPWNGRHVNVMGLEETTSYFHFGLAESAAKNPLSEGGFPTSVPLRAKASLRIPYIMAVAMTPQGFDHVAAIELGPNGESVILKSENGKVASAPLSTGFLRPDYQF